jgi:hypothetical protein
MSDFMVNLKNRPIERTYTVSGTLMDISKSVHGMYRLVECKRKTVTDDELAELEQMARRALKIYQRVEGEDKWKI